MGRNPEIAFIENQMNVSGSFFQTNALCFYCCIEISFSRSLHTANARRSHLEVFLEKFVLKICCKVSGEHPRRSGISIKLLCKAILIEITLRRGCFPVNLLHIFRTLFSKGKDTLQNFSFRVSNQ